MDNRIYNLQNSVEVRKYLRNNMTPQELILWSKLRNNQLGYKFRRQHGIGRYIVELFCKEKKLVIEIDGSGHLDNQEYDKDRTDFLKELNIKVLRFWNNEINNNLGRVLKKIQDALTTP